MRQGDSHKTNLRVLIIALAIVIVGFALAVWIKAQTDGAAAQGQAAPANASPALDDAPSPVPQDEDVLVERGSVLIEQEPTAPQADPTER